MDDVLSQRHLLQAKSVRDLNQLFKAKMKLINDNTWPSAPSSSIPAVAVVASPALVSSMTNVSWHINVPASSSCFFFLHIYIYCRCAQ